MLHAEPFETHLLSAELCVLFIYFLKGNCIGLEYHIILSKIHIIVIIKTKIIDQNKSCSNNKNSVIAVSNLSSDLLSTKDISVTVGLMNLLGGWFGVMPCYHGAGGLTGQYKFGGRSGAWVAILDVAKLVLCFLLGSSLAHFFK